MRAAANGGIAPLFQSPHLVAAVLELGSLDATDTPIQHRHAHPGNP